VSVDASPSPAPARTLGLVHAFLVTVGAMVGSGIFFTPAEIARRTGSLRGALVVWLAGGVLSLLGALSVAELGAAYPRTGGLYVWLDEAFGARVAFLFGWTMLAVLVPSSVAFFAGLSAQHLGAATGLAAGPLAVVLVLVLGLLNARGVSEAAWVQSATTVARAVGIVGLAMLALAHPATAAVTPVAPGAPAPTWSLGAMLGAIVPVLWAYDGWIELTSLAGEVRAPGRTVPRALVGGTAAVVVLYALMVVGLHRALGDAALGASQAPGEALGQRVAGATGARAVSLLVALSTLGACLIGMLSGTRVVAALGTRVPRWGALARLSARGTPNVALAITAVGSLAYLQVASLARLAEVFVVGAWPFYALGAVATMVLRRTRPTLPRPFRTPGYPWVNVAFLLATMGMLGAFAWQSPRATAASLGIVALGLPLYAWVMRRG